MVSALLMSEIGAMKSIDRVNRLNLLMNLLSSLLLSMRSLWFTRFSMTRYLSSTISIFLFLFTEKYRHLQNTSSSLI